MLSVLVGIIVIVVAVIEWFGHVTVPHALAIIIGILGVFIILGGFGDRYYTRL